MVQIIALALGCLFIRLMFPENALVGVSIYSTAALFARY
jgi:hypothetical protein